LARLYINSSTGTVTRVASAAECNTGSTIIGSLTTTIGSPTTAGKVLAGDEKKLGGKQGRQ